MKKITVNYDFIVDKKINDRAKMVFLLVKTLEENSGTVTIQKMSNLLDVSPMTVSTALKDLVENKYLKIEKNGSKNRYVILK